MPITLTGAEFKAFYDDKAFWPGGVWHEDENVYVDGKLYSSERDYREIPDMAQVRVVGGYLQNDEKELGSFEGLLQRWQTAQSTETFLVTVDKDKAAAVRAAVLTAGGVLT